MSICLFFLLPLSLMRMKKILVKSKGGSKVTREGRINQPAINSLEKKRPGKDIERVEETNLRRRERTKKMKSNKEGNGQQHRPGSQEKQIDELFFLLQTYSIFCHLHSGVYMTETDSLSCCNEVLRQMIIVSWPNSVGDAIDVRRK